jgi:quercetin dioxygenase-like cupin family protein
MKKWLTFVVVIAAGFCALVGFWPDPLNAQAGKEAVVWPTADVKWSDNPAVKGAKIAVLWGDPKTGAYGALKTIPAGGTLGLHTHTHDQKVVILSGTAVVSVEGGKSTELGPGSYAFFPGGLKHTADCKVGAECRYFEEQPGASDVKVVKGPTE